ncbi:MAG: SurA N-terminal domain-containing protein, partial [Paracoccaceae bacterium]|nr:SurA N-terminal domain-containing protein [Paracoccaceae bacterium]
MTRPALFLAAVLSLVAGAGASPAQQSPFEPRMIINERAITNFEVTQRRLMLQLFRAPGDLEQEALNGLIEDRLRMQAAGALGLKATPEQVTAGMEEFAGRAQMNAEQFTTALGQAGVSAQTFRDFVEAGLIWREVVRARFLPRTQITEAEI